MSCVGEQSRRDNIKGHKEPGLGVTSRRHVQRDVCGAEQRSSWACEGLCHVTEDTIAVGQVWGMKKIKINPGGFPSLYLLKHIS